jgi:8-oxo-dGTP pyrophosphatase MutT (NUDIX family)
MKNPTNKWELIRKGEFIDLKLFKARFDWYLNKRNNEEDKMVFLDAADAVCVVALTTNGTLLLVKQFRFGVEEETLEAPGGLVDADEDKLIAAQRELREETGFTGGNWTFLQTIQSNPVFMNNYIHQYLAVGVEKTDELKLDIGENIEVVEIQPEDLKDLYEKGLIRHPHTMTALLKVFDLWEKVPLKSL